jgi:predicted ATPase/DNA-binding winged helix-turn-helix (wHTH) protein
MNGPRDPLAVLEFGRFKVVPHRRELLADGKPVALGGRAFDTLLALLDAAGSVVDTHALIRRVWPDRVVDENNLQAQISALRKALGADRELIRTVAGRGYQFTGEIRTAAGAPPTAPRSNLPEPVSELIGRDACVREVVNLVTTQRLVTLTGAGGIGKTRLGLEVARQLLPRFADGVALAELGSLSDPQLVAMTVAAALGLAPVRRTVPVEGVAAALGGRHVLVLLDNCEHLIDAAAHMAEALLRAGPLVCVIATSREPLRTPTEYVYRVRPLDVPDEDNVDADDVLRHGAVKLFVARVQAAATPRYELGRRVTAAMAAICRHLDGIPLAIELAAARVAAFGVEGVASRLDDRFRLLTAGSRTGLARHQTLRATLDWSYELLSEPERVVLRRLSVMAGSFTLDAAAAIAASRELAGDVVVECLADLVAKSLVSVDLGGAVTWYRLLETTRAYARDKLADSGEVETFWRRHAEYYRDLFERAHAEWLAQPTAEWLAMYGPRLDNVRAALDWTFAPGGDAGIGVALTTFAVPLWFQLSLLSECRVRVERALSALAASPDRDARCELQLQAALGWSLMYTTGPERETGAAWSTALQLAQEAQDTDYQLRALWGLWASHMYNGELRQGLQLAERFCAVARQASDATDLLIGDRMVGCSLHFLGDQTRARAYTERMLERYVGQLNRSDVVRFQFDQRVVARITLARILWLQGLSEQAMRTVQDAIDDALAIRHTLSLCNTLGQAACPLAILTGDLAAADRYARMLGDHAARHGADVWQTYGRCFNGMLLIRRGRLEVGLPMLSAGVDELRSARFVQYYTAFLAALAEGLAGAGQAVRGLAIVDEALMRSQKSDEGWILAELLRLNGELLLLHDAPNADEVAEDHFRRSLECASRQGALSWELRSATSLARFWHRQRKTAQARKLLAAVYGRFTEGYDTADLVTAKALLQSFDAATT